MLLTLLLYYSILITAISIPLCFLAILLIRVKTEADVSKALKNILIISTVFMAVAVYFVAQWTLPDTFVINKVEYTLLGVYFCYLTGLIVGLLIGLFTEYYTSHDFKPVKEIAEKSETGSATNTVFGIALGFHSVCSAVIVIAIAIFISFQLAGMYGFAITALGMLGTLIIGLTIDAYGPVADNAGGIAEMAELGPEIRQKTDVLDASGNTTAAIGKGYAIGSAILTSLALIAAFLTRAELLSGKEYTAIHLLDPLILSGLFVGTTLPFVFSALTMKSVGKAAFDMIEEVRKTIS